MQEIMKSMDMAVFLGKKTLILGDVNSGKTTLTREILDGFCRQGLGGRIAVMDLAPEIPEEVLRRRGLAGVGGKLEPPGGCGAATLHATIFAPRLTSSSEEEAMEKAAWNRKVIDGLLIRFESLERDILFINDVSLSLQAGNLDRITGLLEKTGTAVVNGYFGEKLGQGELSRREREAMDGLAAWFRSRGTVIAVKAGRREDESTC
jgi:ABC-type sugar transport system ATPase subunit